MKKETNPDPKLGKRLAGYTAAAGALMALAPVANAQIIYSGEQNIDVEPMADPVVMDLDDDGVDDFMMYLSFSSSQYTTMGYYISVAEGAGVIVGANPTYSNSWLGSLSTYLSYFFPAALNADATVDASASNWINPGTYGFPAVLLEYFHSAYVNGPATSYSYFRSYGNFRGETAYLGIRFYIGTNLHYGWLRLSIPESGSLLTVVDWAYNSDAEEGMTTGFVESAFDNEDIYYGLSATIGLNFNEPISNLALEDIEISGGMVSGLSALTPGEVYELSISGDEEGIINIQLPTGAVDSEGKVVLGAHTQFTMITSLGLNNTLENSVKVFPNPAHQEITIHMDGEADLSILNSLGQEVLHIDRFRGDRINISHLPQGSYTALFRSEQESFTRKFIKE